MAHVFISYSRTDRAYVDKLASHLAAAGVPVWYDYEIQSGDSFAERIKNAIDECTVFLPVLTPASASSKWVLREIARADRLHKPMRPLLRAQCDLPLELDGLQHEDFASGQMPSATFVSNLRQIAHSAPTSASALAPAASPSASAAWLQEAKPTQPIRNPYVAHLTIAPVGYTNHDEKTWSLLAHYFGALAGFIAPLAVLLINPGRSRVTRAHALAVLNFQLTWAFIALAGFIAGDLVSIGMLTFGVPALAWAISAAFSLRGGLKANDGVLYDYPLTVRLIR